MSIPDMAKAFCVIDPNHTDNCNDKIAVIDCHYEPPGYKSIYQAAVNKCTRPEFKLDRYVRLFGRDENSDLDSCEISIAFSEK